MKVKNIVTKEEIEVRFSTEDCTSPNCPSGIIDESGNPIDPIRFQVTEATEDEEAHLPVWWT